MEKVTGKITDIENGGVFGDKKDMTSYEVTLDDGKIYIKYMPVKYKFSFKVNDEVDIDYEEKKNARGEIYLKASTISKKGEKPFKSTYNDPDEIKKIAMSICIAQAIKFFEASEKIDETKKTENDIIGAAKLLYNWVIDVDEISRDVVSRRWYAIEQAIDFCKITGTIDEKNKIKDVAESFLNATEGL